MNGKKLSLDAAKKAVLDTALLEAGQALGRDMGRIYESTRRQALAASDRILLTAAQAQIVKCALERYRESHGSDIYCSNMLLQLTHSRKDYARLMELA